MKLYYIICLYIIYISSIESTHKPTKSPHSTPYEDTEPTFKPTLSPDFVHITTLQPTPDQITLQPTPSNFPIDYTHEPTNDTPVPTPAPTGSTVWNVSDTFIVFSIVIIVAVVLILYLFFFTPEVTKLESLSEEIETSNRNQETSSEASASESTPLIMNNNDNEIP